MRKTKVIVFYQENHRLTFYSMIKKYNATITRIGNGSPDPGETLFTIYMGGLFFKIEGWATIYSRRREKNVSVSKNLSKTFTLLVSRLQYMSSKANQYLK